MWSISYCQRLKIGFSTPTGDEGGVLGWGFKSCSLRCLGVIWMFSPSPCGVCSAMGMQQMWIGQFQKVKIHTKIESQPVEYKESQFSAGWLKQNFGLHSNFLDLNFPLPFVCFLCSSKLSLYLLVKVLPSSYPPSNRVSWWWFSTFWRAMKALQQGPFRFTGCLTILQLRLSHWSLAQPFKSFCCSLPEAARNMFVPVLYTSDAKCHHRGPRTFSSLGFQFTLFSTSGLIRQRCSFQVVTYMLCDTALKIV